MKNGEISQGGVVDLLFYTIDKNMLRIRREIYFIKFPICLSF